MNDTNCAPTLLVNFTTTKYEHYRSQSVLQTLLLEQAKQNPNPNLKKGTNKNANPNVTNRSCAITFTGTPIKIERTSDYVHFWTGINIFPDRV